MTAEAFKLLIEKYKAKKLDGQELAILLDLLHNPEKRQELEQLFGNGFPDEGKAAFADSEMSEFIYQRIQLSKATGPAISFRGRVSRLIGAHRRIAAAILLLLTAGTVLLVSTHRDPQRRIADQPVIQHLPANKKDIAPPPGGKALLTMGDGSTLALDNVKKGLLATQGNTEVQKMQDGQLAYTVIGKADRIMYNKLEVPRGSQYEITLQDGTKVWLNAASSLRYPTGFPGPSREVELTGEAYFEVAANPNMPFRVKLNKMQIEVLGTHFNVKAYEEENSINTTLLEGSVKIISGQKSTLLLPGQQARLNRSSARILTENVHADEAIAWKEGLFEFNSENIQSIMGSISRWYDLDVKFEGRIPDEHFSGSISRNVNLSQVLKILELGGVRFNLHGKNITVLK